jgi:hypothetical protein
MLVKLNVKTRHLLLILLIAGCSSTRQVTFESEPPGAMVRVGGEEYITPCAVDLTDDKTTVEMALGPEQVILVDVPEGYGFWDRTGEAAGTAGAYALYGIAAPFIVAGIVGEVALAGGSDFSGGDPYVGLVIVASAISGKVIGDLITVSGESLEDSSDLKEHSVLVIFPVASPTPNPSPGDDEPGSYIAPTPGDARGTPTPHSSMLERSLLY